MASMVMTRGQSRSVIFLLLAVTLVGVQGRLNPEDFTFTSQSQYPYFRKPVPDSTGRLKSQSTNLDESSQLWASTQNTQNAGVTLGYNYATEQTKASEDKVWTPELLARIKAYNEVQQAMYDYNRESLRFEGPVKTTTTSGSNQYPKVFADGTELLWVTEPLKATKEEMPQLGRKMEKPTATEDSTEATSQPGAQRNEVKSSTDNVETNVFNIDTTSWEAGPWGTKHRTGEEHSLTYIGYGGFNEALPASSDPSYYQNSP